MNLTHKKSLMLAVAAALGMVTPLTHASLITTLVDGKDTTAVKFAIEERGEASKEYYGRTTVSSATTQGALTDQDLTVHIPVIAGYTVTQANRMVVRLTLTGGAKFANKPYLVCANTSIAMNGSTIATTVDSKWSDGTLGRSGASNADRVCVINAAGGNLAKVVTTTDVCSTAVSIYASDGTSGVSAFYMSPDTGGKGNTTATFTLPEKLVTRVGVPNGSGAGCILTFGRGEDFLALASAGGAAIGGSAFVTAFTVGSRQDIGLKAEITYVDAGINTIKTFEGTIIKFVTALAGTVKAGSPHTIDVGKKASKEFTNGTIVKVGEFSLSAGLTQGAGHGTPRVSKSYDDYVVGNTNLVSGVISGFTITLSGPTIAGAKQAWLDTQAGCNGTKIANAEVVAAAAGGAGGAGGAAGSSVSIIVTGITDATNYKGINLFTNPATHVCLEALGTTVLSDGQLTATLAGLQKSTSFELDLGSGGNLSKIDRNGALVRVLNIPAVGNADQPFIRFYNTSSQPAQVRGTLYDQDGKIIGTENSVLFSTLKANDVEILDAAKLQAKVGVTTPWTGRAWLLIQADVDKEAFKVQAMIRTPGTPGVLVNLSGEAYN